MRISGTAEHIEVARTRILSIGFDFPGGAADCFPFRSDQSLLDADIVVFEPDISGYASTVRRQDRRVFSPDSSYRLEEDLSRWRSELTAAVDSGKTVFVFMSKLEEVFIQKCAIDEILIDPFADRYELRSNYSAIPWDLGRVVPSSGRRMKLVGDALLLSEYWESFAAPSVYEVYLEGQMLPEPILATMSGNRTVGAIHSQATGSVVFVPPIRYDQESLVTLDRTSGQLVWSAEAIMLGKRLASCLARIHETLRTKGDATPPPQWTEQSQYRLKEEGALEEAIAKLTKQVAELQDERSAFSLQLRKATSLRRLLYEKGALLEGAVLEALVLLGFEAEAYEDRESEFDALFVSTEGRFLGEAEGKDNKAIGVDKLRQLDANLQEDFARDEVSQYAKGVLFGNAFRLLPPPERPDFFTAKCLSGAHRTGVALVRTPDLFVVAKYMKEHADRDYARLCREALLQTEGEIVVFPPLPQAGSRPDGESVHAAEPEDGPSSSRQGR